MLSRFGTTPDTAGVRTPDTAGVRTPLRESLIFKDFAFRPLLILLASNFALFAGAPLRGSPRLRRGSPSPIKCPPTGGAHQLPGFQPAPRALLGRGHAAPRPLGLRPLCALRARAPVGSIRQGWVGARGWATLALSTLRSNPLFNTKRENLKKLVEQGRRPRSWGLWVCGRRLGSRWAIPVVRRWAACCPRAVQQGCPRAERSELAGARRASSTYPQAGGCKGANGPLTSRLCVSKV